MGVLDWLPGAEDELATLLFILPCCPVYDLVSPVTGLSSPICDSFPGNTSLTLYFLYTRSPTHKRAEDRGVRPLKALIVGYGLDR